MNDLKQIEEELRKEGAGKEEAEVLSLLAKNISNTLSFERSESIKHTFLGQVDLFSDRQRFSWIRPFASVFAVVLFFTVVTVVSAQASLPGQPLYPVKKLSEKVAVALRPSIKDEIITRRSEEIKGVSGIKSSDQLKSAVDNYESELNKTETLPATRIEENKRNLEDAIKNSSGDDLKILEEAISKTEEKNSDIKNREDIRKETTPSIQEGEEAGSQSR